MKEEKDKRILLPLGQFENRSFVKEPLSFSLTEEEKRAFPNLISLEGVSLTLDITGTNHLFTVTILASGQAKVKDAHDGKERAIPVDDSVDVVVSPDDLENSDLVPDTDGNYDLRGAVLALLFDAIPDNYSEVPLKTVTTEDYTLMSEEEYNRRKAQRSPFADWEEKEEK